MIAAEHNGVVFTAKELDRKIGIDEQCAKCAFADATFRECIAVCIAATAAGMPDCDYDGPRGNPVIYVKTTKGDVRQLDLAGPV